MSERGRGGGRSADGGGGGNGASSGNGASGGGSVGVVAAIRAELVARAADRGGIEQVAVGEAVEFRVRGRPIAVAETGSISFRLSAPVARAAAATPDAAPSSRGPDWVRFAPVELDRFALDRATAWFDLALRLAAGD